MSTQKGWILGLSLASILAGSGALGYFLGSDRSGTTGLSPQTITQSGVDRPVSNGPDLAAIDASPAFDSEQGTRTLSYLGLNATTEEGTPKVCLRFSSQLNADSVITDKAFVRVAPEAPFSLQVDGRSLCLLGLDEEAEQTVTVLPGFAAANGAELTQQIVETVTFDPKPAMVGFVGDGIILPRTDNAVLGLKAMNADAVDLTLYRVNHRALFDQTPEMGETTVEGDWSWNSEAWNTRVEIHTDQIDMSGAVNALVEVGYPLASVVSENGPGAYIVEIKRATEANRAATAWRWLYVTDLALASYRTSDALDVTVRSIATARTVSDVKLTVIARNNDVLAVAQSDANGRARFPGAALRGTGNMAPKMVLAYAGDEDFAALDLARSPLDLTAYDVTGRDASGLVDAFMFTERGVYRPGETVHLTALIRDAQAKAAFDRDGTLIIRRPDGTEFSEARVSPRDEAGALIRQILLPKAAARGRWTAELSLDGLDVVGSVRFAVEDFIPEQLRLDVRADESPVQLGTPRPLTIAADFLYGAKGRGLDAEAEARVSVDPNPFPQWADYGFDDAVETYREQFVFFGQGSTSEDGLFQTSIELAGDEFRSSSPLRLFVTAGVAEPSGRYVRDSLFLPLRSEPVYVGFDPAFDGGYAKRNMPANIALIAVDAMGEQIAADGTISLIREDYDYHWYREDGRWRYRRDRRDIIVEEASLSLSANEPYQFSKALPYGEYRLQFVTDAGARFSYQFGSGWRRAGGDADTPDRLEIGLSQASVTPGDTIVLTVNSPFSGVGELVIADRAVKTVQTIRINEGESEIRLPISKAWTTDLYAMVTVYTPGAEAQPRRAVGLVHIPMDRSKQTLAVSLDMPERVLPRTQQEVVVKVAGLDGEQAFLTLAAVDTGILQITDYNPPEPDAYYFGKLAFPIDVFDDYARMLAPFSSRDRVGGDALGGAGLSVVPTTVVSLFQGPVSIRNGTATVTLDVPDFQGELTVMAVAWSKTKLGSDSARMIVRDPVTVQLSLPRFLAPGDRAIATVAMDNVDGANGDYIALVSRDGLDVGEAQRTLAQGERSEDGIALVAEGAGVSTYTLSARGPDFTVSRDYQIETRSANLPETRTRFVKLDAGADVTLDFTEDRSGLIAQSMETLVSASFSPGLDPRPLIASLQHYPYGCTEQTVSVAMPLLLSESLGNIPGFGDDQRRRSVQAAVDTVLSRQSSDGAFGLWSRGDGNASPYLQLYASDFILQAEADGLTVPAGAKRRTLDAVRSIVNLDENTSLSLDYNFGLDNDSPDYELRSAERAAIASALLARHDRVKKSDLLYLDRRFGERMKSSIAQSHLGFALAAMGETDRAQAAFARAAIRIGDEGMSYYDSDVRNAAALVALSDTLPEAALTSAMLTLQVDQPENLNTHEKSWVLRALAGRRTSGVPFSGSSDWIVSGAAASRTVSDQIRSLTLSNSESAPVWVQVSVTGRSSGVTPARSQGATLAKTLFDMNGNPMRVGAISRGERLVILIDADAGSRDSAMWIMADLLPAGFEIETILTPEDAGETGPFAWLGDLSSVDMTEARDDRFIASWRTASRYDDSTRRVAYVVRAVTQGDFTLPGAHLEDMYRPSRMASTASGRISVTPQPTL
ncbi:alpha-2-macroglobulin [Algimonas arctica]|uniref:Alpha-2-macroglobulin n=1 Tax=Algimonas arctica TaxID=1479486 RepID=A0A8J3CKR4_9PROT|nr:MG2 domain-containing protein [Algimonas arctica]GHA82528.1 alpha-2-macroglobulin [Algimonas arctica]